MVKDVFTIMLSTVSRTAVFAKVAAFKGFGLLEVPSRCDLFSLFVIPMPWAFAF